MSKGGQKHQKGFLFQMISGRIGNAAAFGYQDLFAIHILSLIHI